MDFKTEKDRLRTKILQKRDVLPKEVIEEKSQAIASMLFASPSFERSSVVMFYVSFRSEVKTHEMIKRALNIGKKVAVPFTDIAHQRLIPSKVEDVEDVDKELFPNALGIPEPLKEHIRPVKISSIDLVIVPGSVFDYRGGRAGYGYGYYDHFLRQIERHTKRVALAFELQVVDKVPMEPSDEYVDFIITENRIIHCNTSEGEKAHNPSNFFRL